MNRVIVSSAGGNWPKLEKKTKKIAERVLNILKKQNFYLEIYLVDNKTIAFLNKKFRGKNKPTNVLSFQFPKDWLGFFSPPVLRKKPLGEIYIAPQYILFLKENFDQLLIHGLLHILGFDHDSKDDRMRMEKYERKLWQKVFSSV